MSSGDRDGAGLRTPGSGALFDRTVLDPLRGLNSFNAPLSGVPDFAACPEALSRELRMVFGTINTRKPVFEIRVPAVEHSERWTPMQ